MQQSGGQTPLDPNLPSLDLSLYLSVQLTTDHSHGVYARTGSNWMTRAKLGRISVDRCVVRRSIISIASIPGQVDSSDGPAPSKAPHACNLGADEPTDSALARLSARRPLRWHKATGCRESWSASRIAAYGSRLGLAGSRPAFLAVCAQSLVPSSFEPCLASVSPTFDAIVGAQRSLASCYQPSRTNKRSLDGKYFETNEVCSDILYCT